MIILYNEEAHTSFYKAQRSVVMKMGVLDKILGRHRKGIVDGEGDNLD